MRLIDTGILVECVAVLPVRVWWERLDSRGAVMTRKMLRLRRLICLTLAFCIHSTASGESSAYSFDTLAFRQEIQSMNSWNFAGLVTTTLGSAMVLSSTLMAPWDRAKPADHVRASIVLGVGWAHSIAGPIPGVVNEKKLSRHMLRTGKKELSYKGRRSYHRSFAWELAALVLGGLSMAAGTENENAAITLAASSKLLSILALFERQSSAIHVMRYANRVNKTITGGR